MRKTSALEFKSLKASKNIDLSPQFQKKKRFSEVKGVKIMNIEKARNDSGS